MEDLTALPNIGETLAGKLNEIGITSLQELTTTGSVEAVLRIRDQDRSACYNMLYALEGAILGIRWHSIPKEDRQDLKDRFDRTADRIET